MNEKTEISPSITRENLSDEGFEAVNEAIQAKLEVVLSIDGCAYGFLSSVIDVVGDSIILENSIPYQMITTARQGQSSFISIGDFTVEGGAIESDGKNIIFRVLSTRSHLNERVEKRLAFSKDEDVRITFTHPIDKKTEFEKKVLDVSTSGLSFATFFDSALFSKGTKISQIKLKNNNETVKEFNGEIVYKRPLRSKSNHTWYQIGLRIYD